MHESLLYSPWLTKAAAWSAPIAAVLLALSGLVKILRQSRRITLPEKDSSDNPNTILRAENEVLLAIAQTETRIASPSYAIQFTLCRTILALCLSLFGLYQEARSFALTSSNFVGMAVKMVYFLLVLLQTLRLDNTFRRQSTVDHARLSLLLTFTCAVSTFAVHGRHQISAWSSLSIALLDAFSPNYRHLDSRPTSKEVYHVIPTTEQTDEKQEGCIRPVALGFDNPSFVAGTYWRVNQRIQLIRGKCRGA